MEDKYPLRKKFEELGITQKVVGRALGLSAQYTSKVLNGDGGSSFPNSLKEYLIELGVDVVALERECQQWRENIRRSSIEESRIGNTVKVG